MRSLFQCLLDIETLHLQAIGRFWDVDLAGSSRRGRATSLAAGMATPGAVAEAMSALTRRETGALAAVRAAGGTLPLRVFSRQWGAIRPMGPAKMSREEPWRAPQSPAEGLWYKGFVFTEFRHTPGGSFEVAAVPQSLLDLLPEAETHPSKPVLNPVSPPAIPPARADAMLDDFCTLLAHIHNTRVRAGDGGQWNERDIAPVVARLRVRDLAGLELAGLLLGDLKWVQPDEERELRLASGPVASWLQSPTAEQRETLADLWLESLGFRELLHIRSIEVKGTGPRRSDPRGARRAILRYLAGCSPAEWYEVEHFVSEIKRLDPDFLRPDGDYHSWYIEARGTGRYLTGFESWDAVEGQLAGYILAGPLAWMGLVEVVGTDQGRADAVFRLTDSGAAYLGLADAVPDAEPEPLAAFADFTVKVPATRRFERFQLARVADWVRTGDPYLYRIGPTSLARGAQHSIGVDRVVDFLRRACVAPVPRSVLDSVVRWDTQRSEARLARVDLLTVSAETIMTQIVRSPTASRYIVERIGPTAATVRRREWSKLVEELGKLAILPEIEPPEA